MKSHWHPIATFTVLCIAWAWSFSQVPAVQTLEIGSPAPDFKLKGIDGRMYTLDSFKKAKVLVLIFTANHCPTAQAYEDRIKRLAADYSGRGGAVVCISSNHPDALRLDELGYTDLGDSFEDMKIRAKDMNYNFVYLYDGDLQAAAKAYGPVSTPHAFIFDQKRLLRYAGRLDDSEKIEKVTVNDARNAVEALLAGNNVPVEKTKTFGCSIKWAFKQESVQEALKRWAQEPVALEMIDTTGIRTLAANRTDKLIFLNVWATWCGPCHAEFPELVTIHRMYRRREFEMVTLSADAPEKKENVLAFLKQNQASTRNYLFALDNKYTLIEAVDPAWQGGLPYTLLIKPGGEILYRHVGAIDPLEVKKRIVGHIGRYYR